VEAVIVEEEAACGNLAKATRTVGVDVGVASLAKPTTGKVRGRVHRRWGAGGSGDTRD